MKCITTILSLLFTITASINTYAQLHADFNATPVEGCSPFLVHFTDLSTGDPTNWFWDLGNGITSIKQNPSVVYITSGTYTVKLYIKNAAGIDSITKTDYITVYEKPAVNFTADPTEGCVPIDVAFNDLSTPGSGTIASWLWDFGDGNTSTKQNPVHKYNIVDSFAVTLEVTNSNGCKQLLNKQQYIKLNSRVNAGFTYMYDSSCTAPVAITFNNTSSSNKPLTFQWDFGDGSAISTQNNPQHTYLTTGSFMAKLVATNINGCTDIYTEEISVGTLITGFTFTGACENTPTIFIDTSSPTPLNEKWDFGDATTGTGVVTSHTYTKQGTYVVSLYTDFGACADSTQKNIVITDDPVADFDVAGNRHTCNYPVTIQFINKSKDAKTYKWIFNNGTTSLDANPTYTYNQPGNFDVVLIAFNANGCNDTIVKKDFIEIGAPQIQSIQNLPFQGCAPQPLTLTPVINSDTLMASYLWQFGDGTTSSSPMPTHTYNTAGVYNVTLIVTKAEGCADTLYIPKAVSLADKPKALFTATPLNTCASTPVVFTDASTGTVTEWIWNFGDGSGATGSSPSHYYNDTGYFDIKLIAGKFKCFDTLMLKKYVHIDGPIANFTAVAQCSNPFTYQFTDNSIAATSWLWDFGDGNSSTNTSPSNTYKSTGKYVIKLTVSNGVCTSIAQYNINVVQEQPVITYKFLSSNSCMYDSVLFNLTKYNAANILTYQWNFGDGISTTPNAADSIVNHSYNKAGYYSPFVIIRNINNCLDTVYSLQIKVIGPAAAFTNNSGGCLFSTINFNDASLPDTGSSIIRWIWNYGDNTKPDTLAAGPFMHTYNSTGTFDVSLKIIDNNNCYDTATNKGLQITKPLADFSADDTLKCSGSTIQFIDASKGLPLKYNWEFGDGSSSNLPSPLHQYAYDSVFNVKLTVQDKNGCVDSLIKPNYILVADPVANFILTESVFVCPPAQLTPINTSSQNYRTVLWDFGDGNTSEEISPQHYYTKAGTFVVKLIVYGYGNCSDSMSKTIIVKGPNADLIYSPFTGCDSLAVSFTSKQNTNIIKYTWDFGDGVTQITKDTFTNYTYTRVGKYVPKLIIEDSNGCQVPIINYDTITIATASANFTAERVPGICDSSLYNFTDLGQVLYDAISTYQWQFDDGDSSRLSNPQHFYNKPGLYSTSLKIITKIGCQSTYQLPVNVAIDSLPKLFTSIPDSACTNTNVQLTAEVANDSAANYTWLWNLGDGQYANANNYTYSYSVPGTYNISVSATTAAGCANTVAQTLLVNPTPQTNAGADITICRDQSATLQASGADTYKWVSDGSLSCLSCANQVASPLVNTTFHVTGTNIFGCKAIDSVMVLVKQPITVSAFAPDTICTGTTIQLKASGAELYQWSPPDIVANNTDSVTSSTPLSTVTYTIVGTDSEGCFSDAASFLVNVFPIPAIQLKDSVVDIAVGSNYQLIATGSPDVSNWLWMPASNISCTNCSNPVVTPRQTTTYTVRASNIAGCYSEKRITVNVSCNQNENLFIPNTFSPNADGTNDYFYPRGKGLMTIKSLRIFNRLGAIVFERGNFPSNQQSYGWDGKYNGKALQPDVYVYVIEIVCENNQILATKGNITLLR